MMHVHEVDYNHETGRVTVIEAGQRHRTFAEEATELRLQVGDDVAVRAAPRETHVETLTRDPLQIRWAKQDAPEGGVLVRTARRPSSEDLPERPGPK